MKVYRVTDETQPFYIEDFKDCDHLIIPMSGYNQKFEWFGTMKKFRKDYNFSIFWLRDLSKAYWNGTFPGLEKDGIWGISDFITNKIKESKAKKVMTIGLSMGGYGAIAVGCLCNVDLVLSFSGQTYLPEKRREKYNLYPKWEGLVVKEKDINLKLLFDRCNKNKKTNYKLFYGNFNKSDTDYAENLNGQRGVDLYPVNTTKHNSVRPAMRSGLFRKFLIKFLTEK